MSVPLAGRNLLHEKGKFLLSILGVAASLILIMLLFGFRSGLFLAATAYLDHMDADLVITQSGTQGSFSSSAIPAAIHSTLASTSGAVEVEHALVADIIFTHGDVKSPVALVGYNLETGIGGPWDLSEGRKVENDEEVVLDTWLAQRAGLGVSDTVDILGRTFRIVGLSRGTSSWLATYIFLSRSAAEELLQLPGIASFYLLRLPPGTDVVAVAQAIEDQVPSVETMTPTAQAARAWKILATVLDTPINLMILIGVITSAAVIALTAYAAIIDRMREYGVLKAVGADGSWLRRLVITETLYRAVLGFGLGTALSYLTAQLIMDVFPQFTIIILPQTIAITGLIAGGMTVIAALLPIREVMRLDPALVFKV